MKTKTVYQFDIDGQTRTFDFGMYCWSLFCEKMDVSPAEVLTAFTGPQTFKALRYLLFFGITANDHLRGLPDSITEVESVKMINDSPELIGDIFNVAVEAFIALNQKAVETKIKGGEK